MILQFAVLALSGAFILLPLLLLSGETSEKAQSTPTQNG